MSVVDKANEIKKLISLVCEVLPIVVSVIKEVLLVMKEIKTV